MVSKLPNLSANLLSTPDGDPDAGRMRCQRGTIRRVFRAGMGILFSGILGFAAWHGSLDVLRAAADSKETAEEAEEADDETEDVSTADADRVAEDDSKEPHQMLPSQEVPAEIEQPLKPGKVNVHAGWDRFPLPRFDSDSDDVEPWDLPLLERPGLEPGWFAAQETAFILPHVKSNLTTSGPPSFVTSTGGAPPLPLSTLQLPSSVLSRGVMPRFDFGYRMAGGYPALKASYRFLNTDGSGTVSNFDASGSGSQTNRLNVQVLDLDAVYSELFYDPPRFYPQVLSVTAGVRVAGTRFSSVTQGQTITNEFGRNTFVGAGPHAAFDLTWPVAATPGSIFAKADFAGVIGTNRENFTGTVTGPGGTTTSIFNPGKATTGIAIIGARGGAAWNTNWNSHKVGVSAGYLWERWFFLGNDAGAGALGAELILKGPFVRGEFAF